MELPSYNELYPFIEAGIQVDMLGQPLKVGDTVLTNGYCNTGLNYITTIKKINKKSVVVNIHKRYTSWGRHMPKPTHIPTGTVWNYYPDRKTIDEVSSIRRRGTMMIKIPPNLVATAQQEFTTLKQNHPELLI